MELVNVREHLNQSAQDWADKGNHVAFKRNVKRKFTQEAFVRDDLKMSPKENSKYDTDLFEEELSYEGDVFVTQESVHCSSESGKMSLSPITFWNG